MVKRTVGVCLVLFSVTSIMGYTTEVRKNKKPGPVYHAAAVAKILDIEYSEEELKSFGNPPEALPGYVTFFDPGWSILQLCDDVEDKGTIFSDQTWYALEPFARVQEKPCYRQLRMQAVKRSFGHTFENQQKLLTKEEEVPLARRVVAGMVIHFLISGERLYPTYWVRCADKDSDGYRVDVGLFAARVGLVVNWDSDWLQSWDLGVVAARKAKGAVTK